MRIPSAARLMHPHCLFHQILSLLFFASIFLLSMGSKILKFYSESWKSQQPPRLDILRYYLLCLGLVGRTEWWSTFPNPPQLKKKLRVVMHRWPARVAGAEPTFSPWLAPANTLSESLSVVDEERKTRPLLCMHDRGSFFHQWKETQNVVCAHARPILIVKQQTSPFCLLASQINK